MAIVRLRGKDYYKWNGNQVVVVVQVLRYRRWCYFP